MIARLEDQWHKPIPGVYDVPMMRNPEKNSMTERVMPQLAIFWGRYFVLVPGCLPPTYREAVGVHRLEISNATH